MHCLYGGYNLHRFSDALGLVILLLASELSKVSAYAKENNSAH